MADDLGLSDKQYSLSIVVFVIGYIIGQVPSKYVYRQSTLFLSLTVF